MSLRDKELTLCAIMVPPNRPGVAYAHTSGGLCAAFTGDREELLKLFHLLRANLKGEAPPVVVSSNDWPDSHLIDRPECPNHMLAQVETGEISAYVPY